MFNRTSLKSKEMPMQKFKTVWESFRKLIICFIDILGLDLCLTSQPKIAPWLDYSLLFQAIILQLINKQTRNQMSLIHLMWSFYTHAANKSNLEQLSIFLKALQMSS